MRDKGSLKVTPALKGAIAMAAGDIIQAVIRCQAGVQAGLNVRHYLSTAVVGSSVSMQAVANGLHTALEAAYVALLSDQASFSDVTAQKILPAPMSMPAVSSNGAEPGALTGDLLPRQVAGLISFRTAFAGRRFRGRAYIPFPSEAVSETDSTPTAAYLTDLGTLAMALITPISVIEGANTETFVPQIFHRDTGTVTTILSAMVHDAWATQRRRGSFGRPNQGTVTGGVIIAP